MDINKNEFLNTKKYKFFHSNTIHPKKMDYKKIGFKCGIEVHQQLEGRKLFCNCPSAKKDAPADFEIKRYLRASAGESEEIDIAAKFESEKKRYYFYEGHYENTCLLELDETPPYSINEEALEISLILALMFNSEVVDCVQFMRKIVVDGSNTSGFQRTALIATGGHINTSKGPVKISTICLEEEAAQKIHETDEFVSYNLDRLGIPLIEISTDASIQDPEHARESASMIGMFLRSINGIKRGIGTIRQDVNISIQNSGRTEIKGFQDLNFIPKVIDFEIKRQLTTINLNKDIKNEVRKAEKNFTTSFLRPLSGSARLYPETDIAPIIIKQEKIEKIKKSLPQPITNKIENIISLYKITKDYAKDLINIPFFEEFTKKFKNIEPNLIAHVLISIPKEIKKRFNLDSSSISKQDFDEILQYLNDGKIAKEGLIDLFLKKLKKEKIDIKEFKSFSEDELEEEIKKLIIEKKAQTIGAYMGILMNKYRGKIDGKKIMEFLMKNLKNR